ncbi:hypothetical protein E3E38_07735 [Thermococcus sp. 18S1]|uniref:type I restriction endonuclease n=1 Tax=Thermococcus sp. 18S1 TaxID=1638210 RepID=UPI001439D14B|nr:type I restriction endonuclease [Thermococcus sp. 18S1]NJE30931.1 hypothetical protein [Thermococcus sp. 18S1]
MGELMPGLFSSPLEEKIEAIIEIYPRISNEEATKQHMILPLLKELGWRIDKPHEVYPERQTRNKRRPDYTLLVDGKPVAFLEAKSAKTRVIGRGGVVSKHARQLIGYCFEEGVALGVLTNGTQWVLMETFKLWTRPENRVITMVDLRKLDIEEAADKMLAFTRRNIRLYYQKFGYRLGEKHDFAF